MSEVEDYTGRTGRNETREEQMDRNWAELLQELRVLQTGVQILAGFLLTLPFQQRFEKLDDWEVGLYLTNVVSAGTAALVFDVAAGRSAGVAAGGALLGVMVVMLVFVPLRLNKLASGRTLPPAAAKED
ncbi:hypothetical protein J2S98_002316 [Arthrobacter oryzae]|uniref:DUF6328 family protein n=1 Tax=Arthrobacter TaxID=1663 RepID=UPI001F3C5FF2|nr:MULTISPECIES: DUF6328 family protein [Arthrobacter]MDP9987157.1 hypothetical protein [Arthrobacter oryzae]UKA71479.1 DUF6328 family protein [Arthrobacter sp. FW306-06-A]